MIEMNKEQLQEQVGFYWKILKPVEEKKWNMKEQKRLGDRSKNKTSTKYEIKIRLRRRLYSYNREQNWIWLRVTGPSDSFCEIL